ncbi:hypothetical protein TNCT_27241 [Trichonephila clavata]|uniref:Uncharacterized protein n=1 Tax=Trichonephila clavata TaxID=2740835 RepID=A0A8X6HCC0_TRICU|nr:hypothetical protein TNCT_27241 [Trichonephila clavata]
MLHCVEDLKFSSSIGEKIIGLIQRKVSRIDFSSSKSFVRNPSMTFFPSKNCRRFDHIIPSGPTITYAKPHGICFAIDSVDEILGSYSQELIFSKMHSRSAYITYGTGSLNL